MSVVVSAAPCAKCPFRKDVPIYLRRDRRVEIAEALLSGGSFPCHATVSYEEDDEGNDLADEANAVECAGAAKALLLDGTSSQHLRIAERLGMVDLAEVERRGPDVWRISEWQDLAEGATGDDPIQEEAEGEPCSVANESCLAPAGYAMGGGIVVGTETADLACSSCYEPVCENCSTDGVCDYCVEREAEGS